MSLRPDVNQAGLHDDLQLRPMFGGDAIWQRLETADSPMVIGALLSMAPFGLEQLRQRVAERLLSFERFRCRAVQRSGLWFWAPVSRIDLQHHVRWVDTPLAAVSDSSMNLAECVARQMSQPLCPQHPGWELLCLTPAAEQAEGQMHLLIRVHHCYADGLSLVRLLEQLCDDPPVVGIPRRRAKRRATPSLLSEIASLTARSADSASALKSRSEVPGGPRQYCWSSPLPERDLRRLARQQGCSVNDLLLAAVSGGVRQWLLDQEDSCPDNLHVSVPVYVGQQESAFQPGNHIGMLRVALAAHLETPQARLAYLSEQMRHVQQSVLPQWSHWAMVLAGCLPGDWQARLMKMLGERASLVVSNVRGPRKRLHLLGTPIHELMFWVPCGGRVDLGFSLISYAGSVRIGLAAASSLPGPPQVLLHHTLAGLEAFADHHESPGLVECAPLYPDVSPRVRKI